MIPSIGGKGSYKKSKVDLLTGLQYYWNFESSFDAVNATIGTGGTTLPTRENTTSPINSYYTLFSTSNRLTYSIRPTTGDTNKFNSTDFSISFWYKKTSTSISIVSSIYHTTAGYRNFRIYIDTNISFYVTKASDTAATWNCIVTAPSLNNWHHVVVTFKSSTNMIIYVDGIASTPTTVNGARNIAAVTGQALYFNYDYVDSYSAAAMYLDEVATYSKALTQVEVTALYSSSYKFYPFT